MAAPRNKTSTTSLKWEVELFPFNSTYPSKTDFSSSGSGGARVSAGIKQMSFVRGKGTPDAKCTFTITGSPPRQAIAGTWVVISSYQNKAVSGYETDVYPEFTDSEMKKRAIVEGRKPRFIGQITTISTLYVTDGESGLISQSTTYQVREWSHALTVPVRLDLLALAKVAAPGFAQIAVATKDTVDVSAITKLIEESLNPFQVAGLILAVIGALQENDKPSGIDIKILAKYNEVATKMPSIPQSLLSRLGIKAKPNSAFTSGFLKVITGVQTAPMLNDGSWSGVFGPDSMSLNDFGSKFNRSPSDRPAVLGASAILQSGESAWQLLQSYCDPSLNEFYTDFVHELNNDGSIGARPVLMMRDMPFSMRFVEKTLLPPGAAQLVRSFSKYDNLPRIGIPQVNIAKFSFTNTIINSPNYIRVNFRNQDGNSNLGVAVSRSRGAVRLDEEINRFGGNEFAVESNYLGYNDGSAPPSSAGGASGLASSVKGAIDSGKNLYENATSAINKVKGGMQDDVIDITEKFDFVKWSDKMKLITQSWHAYDYRMGNGTLVLKDDNFSLTCGFNAQFQIGDFSLVGHIDGISTSVMADANGTYITETQVQLSRIVMVPKDNPKQLEFIKPESFCYLTHDTSPKASKSVQGVDVKSAKDFIGRNIG